MVLSCSYSRHHCIFSAILESHFSTSWKSTIKKRNMADKAEMLGYKAKEAFDASQLLESSERSKALLAIRDELLSRKEEVFAANELDLKVC